MQHDSKKYKEAERKANESGARPQTARWYENFLSAYIGKPVDLRHIKVQLIPGASPLSLSLTPCQIFGFLEKNNKRTD